MRFLIDRCAGQLLADWLRRQGHDVVDSRELGPDPGDRALLEWAAKETRILVTIDTDFGANLPRESFARWSDPSTGCARPRTPVDHAGLINALRNRTARCCDHHSERRSDQNLERPKAELSGPGPSSP